jgi:hypothetical protein
MAVGTSTIRPPLLSTTPTRPSRPVPPLKRPVKLSLMAAATKGKRPR